MTFADGFRQIKKFDEIIRYVEQIENFDEIWDRTMHSHCKENRETDYSLEKHSFQVTSCSLEIAEKMKIPKDKMLLLVAASLLHDNGKLAISESTLNKKGKLTNEEIAEINTHPTLGANRIRADVSPNLAFWQEVAEIIEQHHEDYNPLGYPPGSDRFKGYPNKVTGEQIHPLAAIIAVADWYESCREERPYRAGMDHLTALKKTIEVVGARLHPQIFEILVYLEKFDLIQGIEEIRILAKQLPTNS